MGEGGIEYIVVRIVGAGLNGGELTAHYLAKGASPRAPCQGRLAKRGASPRASRQGRLAFPTHRVPDVDHA